LWLKSIDYPAESAYTEIESKMYLIYSYKKNNNHMQREKEKEEDGDRKEETKEKFRGRYYTCASISYMYALCNLAHRQSCAIIGISDYVVSW